LGWVIDAAELETRVAALEGRRSRREEVRRRIAAYEARAGACGAGESGASARPDVESLEALARAVSSEHVALVERRAVLADRVAVLVEGPGELARAAAAADLARRSLERAKTVADRCAGLGGGPDSVRLSLENWVLADYLRQVLVQANERLDTMTDGRFALELCDGVTDGRKPWGLDLAVFDANTGQVRPATTLSGGETFLAALALALGLADVVSSGSNREVGALFVDEGFGSLDPQALDAVIDVLRSLEDGGRVVGVISHVRELQQALPCGVTVEPSAGGSLATVHYPPD
jgi:DNA repair protein SbcC/Rad50